jgi:hypothetical protein
MSFLIHSVPLGNVVQHFRIGSLNFFCFLTFPFLYPFPPFLLSFFSPIPYFVAH